MDTIVTVHLALATCLQAGYVLPNGDTCRTTFTFKTYRPRGTDESFFVAAARLNGAGSSSDMCVDFVREWEFGASMSVCYAAISFVGIATFIGSIHRARRRNQSLRDMLNDALTRFRKCIVAIPVMGVVLLRYRVYLLLVFLFRCCLPMCIKGPVRAGRRYIVKAGFGAEQTARIRLEELETELNNKNHAVERYRGVQGQATPLAQFLGIYDILMLISEYLHYVDVMNLSSVSRSIRESVLPPNDLHRRIAVFKLYTCHLDSKTSCWTCPIQTCNGCNLLPLVPQVCELHHLEVCMPYCKSCHYKHIVCGGRGFKPRLRTRECRCAPHPAKPLNAYQRLFDTIKYFTRTERNSQALLRPICQECNKLTYEALMERKTRAAKGLLKRGLNRDGIKWNTCARLDCGNGLGAGPRYWVCASPDCGKEFGSYLHKAWSGRRKGRDDDDDDVIADIV